MLLVSTLFDLLDIIDLSKKRLLGGSPSAYKCTCWKNTGDREECRCFLLSIVRVASVQYRAILSALPLFEIVNL